jgi:NodT family efflux transporter outer membrane factor (OMF) lipoprotein
MKKLIALLLLAGCAVGPDYEKPAAPESPAFRETPAGWKEAQPRDEIARGKWWEIFGDAELNALVEKVDAGNFTLAAAAARQRQAQAAVTIARSGLFPGLDADLSVTRSRSPAGSAGGVTQGRTTTSRSVSLGASWEIDLWGRVRREVEAASAEAQASAGDVASARLSLQAELATSYFALRLLDVQRKLFDDTVAAYRTSLELTNNRYNAGVAARADVVQADAQLKSALSQSVDFGVQRAQLEHAIAVLTGVPPSQLAVAQRAEYSAQLPAIPPGMPSELLERRPDVAAAERRVAAANADIGVAKAAYFPSLILNAAFGFRSNDASAWLTAPSRFWSLGPALALTVFDAGRRGAISDQAIAGYDATVADYRQTVLVAFAEVEDNLAALRVLDEEARLQRDSVDAARESLQLTLNQYKAGTVSFLNVVIAQTALLAEQRAAVQVLNRRLAATVGLVRALGGGWKK